MTYKVWVYIGQKFLFAILGLVTPHIKDALKEMLRALYEKAKATDNIWDDKLIEIIAELLCINLNNDK